MSINTPGQILAIARTEFRFSLRRGAPVVVTALIGLLLGAGILLNTGNNLWMADANLEQFTPEQVERLAEAGITAQVYRSLARDEYADFTAQDTTGAWFFIYLGLLFLPVATAGAVPADRKFELAELLQSLPIDGTIYLAGKVLGTIGIVLFIACFPFLLLIGVLEGILFFVYGGGIPPALILFYLGLSFLDGLPVLIFAAAVGVLAGTGFRSRRAALLPGLVTGILAIAFWFSAFRSPEVPVDTYDLAAYHVFQGYQNIWQASWDKIAGPGSTVPVDLTLMGAEAPVVGVGQVILMYGIALVVLVGAFFLARQWLKWKENF
jgi:ABC-type transport system involved in multi-copper enzyme maturation permease subunit